MVILKKIGKLPYIPKHSCFFRADSLDFSTISADPPVASTNEPSSVCSVRKWSVCFSRAMATAATPVVTNNKFTNLEHQVNRQPEIWL